MTGQHPVLHKVLLVEDDPADIDLINGMLSNIAGYSFEIMLAGSLQQARKLINENDFELVLIDLTLPDAKGTVCIERMLEIKSGLPLVALGGVDDQEAALTVVRHGAQDYLVKGMNDKKQIMRSICFAIERKKVERGLGYIERHDGLTGLVNRSLFMERLNRAIVRANRDKIQVAIMFIDLDRFKHINDTLGHNAGDTLLQEVATRLERCTREQDTVARFGGDEFTILLEGVNHANDAVIVANKIIRFISYPIRIHDQELYVTPSIGITMYPDDADSVEQLMKHADSAMYRAKEEGRNGFQFYTDGMNRESEERMELESRLRQAMHKREFQLFYQPKINIRNGEMIGAEALIRWNQPDLGMVSPAKFIPLAEENGLINSIGEWVIREACSQMQEWNMTGMDPIRVAVNLSPRQLYQQDLADMILDTALEYSIVPRNIELEITESLLMDDTEASITTLKKLKEWGMHVSIDDFGTGYCSLAYLKRFPIETLKIDRSFVMDITTDPDDAAICSAIIALGHKLRLNVTAEGIETSEQLEFLKQQGCDEAQGFYFSKPLPAAEFTDFFVRHKIGKLKALHGTVRKFRKSA
jgi:diguanylate cyclase (GGDEF)-like protein